MSLALDSAAGDGAPSVRALSDDAPHVLVVDDDARIRTLLARYLGREGLRVSCAARAAEARARMEAFHFDLLVVDVMMPGETGVDFVRSLRGAAAPPVLMLTARGEAADRIGGLEAGADDYLAKPFEPRELLLRIRSILRRAMPPAPAAAPGAVRFGACSFRIASGELLRDGARVRLTEREVEILRRLAEAAGEPVSRAALASDEAGADRRAVDVQVTRLRRKIEADPAAPLHLQTARGLGYRLVADAVAADA